MTPAALAELNRLEDSETIYDTPRKSRAEIEELKRQWRLDPCWDIAETEGYEAHAKELKAYQAEFEAKWKEAANRRKAAAELALKEMADKLGCSVELARHISNLEYKIKQLEGAE